MILKINFNIDYFITKKKKKTFRKKNSIKTIISSKNLNLILNNES